VSSAENAGPQSPTPSGETGTSPDTASLREGHEVRDLTPRQAILPLGLLLVAILGILVVVTIFEALVLGPSGNYLPIRPSLASQPSAPPAPAPSLETANGQVLQELHAKEDALLNNYGWIDQKAGAVRIPIGRAMELLVQRGLPSRPQSPGTPASELTYPESSSSGRTQGETVP
jgi:hypothetical protein